MAQSDITRKDTLYVGYDDESPEEIAEINRILEERQRVIDSGKAKWLTSEEVKKRIGL